jgi:hypothetical protein
MAIAPRDGRAMKLASGDRLDVFGDERTCTAADCRVRLSRYNPAEKCAQHAGWIDPVRRRSMPAG